jgi:hypothetical protein
MALSGRGGFRTDARTLRLERLHGLKAARKRAPELPLAGTFERVFSTMEQQWQPRVNPAAPPRAPD